jgi:hypothetical protein
MLPPRIKRKSDKADIGKRSPAHRAWVRGHQCSISGCTDRPIECAHVRRANNSGMGFKPSDAFTLSLCKAHHAESHAGESTFEAKHKIDLMALAREFYFASPHRHKLDNPWGSEGLL